MFMVDGLELMRGMMKHMTDTDAIRYRYLGQKKCI